jgi:YggT family protein
MGSLLIPILILISTLLNLYFWVIIIHVVMSWLLAFDVVNIRNRVVDIIWRTTNALTEPVMRPIRNFMPNLGGIDISPVIVILLIWVIQMYINQAIRALG